MDDLDPDDPNRRDFMTVFAGVFAAVGVGAFMWPAIDWLNPDASALSLASIEVDLSPIEVGQSITVVWRGKPVFIRHRTEEEIKGAKAVSVLELPDPLARNQNLPEDAPAIDRNRATGKENPIQVAEAASGDAANSDDGVPGSAPHENWLVMIGICTHLGCVPKGQRVGDAKGEFGGWFCPCHASHYDTAGRIRKGPAPRNLDVPPYDFLSDTLIKIG